MASYLKFQINRNSRRIRKTLQTWKVWFSNYSHRHVYGGWQKLNAARVVVLAWLLIAVLSFVGLWQQINSINSHYLTNAPSYGGVYSEAITGSVKGVNPLFPENSATSDLVSVVYSGLTKVDPSRQMIPDVASSWVVSDDKKTYTFSLKRNIKWQDGAPLTAEDVAFTIGRIQNPDTKSPLAANWTGVKCDVLDNYTVKFTLPSSYSPFLYNTSVGLIPKHLLDKVRPALLRTYEFNQKPIGSGPFKLREIKDGQDELVLDSFKDYYGGKPYISELHFVEYTSSNDYLGGYLKKQIMGFVVTKPSIEVQSKQIEDLKIHHLNLPAYGALFLNMKSPALTNNNFRQALAYATDKNSIIKDNLDSQATKISYPILAGYSGFDGTVERYDYNIQKAKDIISSLDKQQINNTKLRIVTLKDSVYEGIAGSVKDMWEKVGIHSEVTTVSLDELQQNYIRPRNYDILLYGQDIGFDSDVYSFWHSSQSSDPGLNLSQYSNPDADRFLETGRAAKDISYKDSRFASFLKVWSKDMPAIILYTPFYNYAQNSLVQGLEADKMVEPNNRFLNIQKWYVLTHEATKASTHR